MRFSVVRSRVLTRLLAGVIAITTALAVGGVPAAPVHAASAEVVSLTHLDANLWRLVVRSPAMAENIPFLLLRPTGNAAGAPTLYLLNGAGGGEDGANWLAQTDAKDFFADKNVNVLIPEKGRGTYYTDWLRSDDAIGRPMWETFLTRELPGVVDAELATSGRNAIAGLSMSGTSVFNLAIAAPGLYRSVASYSGCARTSTPEGRTAVHAIVRVAAGADAANMWGPETAPGWFRNDPYVNAEKLRGTTVYLSSGSGLPGEYDQASAQAPGAPPIYEQIVVGGALEAAAHHCTVQMAARLKTLGIPAEIHLPATGTHSWGYWRDELHRSWPTLADGLSS